MVARALVALIVTLRDANSGMRWSAAKALREIGTPAALAALEEGKRNLHE